MAHVGHFCECRLIIVVCAGLGSGFPRRGNEAPCFDPRHSSHPWQQPFQQGILWQKGCQMKTGIFRSFEASYLVLAEKVLNGTSSLGFACFPSSHTDRTAPVFTVHDMV